jgi:hypothetical protein
MMSYLRLSVSAYLPFSSSLFTKKGYWLRPVSSRTVFDGFCHTHAFVTLQHTYAMYIFLKFPACLRLAGSALHDLYDAVLRA